MPITLDHFYLDKVQPFPHICISVFVFICISVYIFFAVFREEILCQIGSSYLQLLHQWAHRNVCYVFNLKPQILDLTREKCGWLPPHCCYAYVPSQHLNVFIFSKSDMQFFSFTKPHYISTLLNVLVFNLSHQPTNIIWSVQAVKIWYAFSISYSLSGASQLLHRMHACMEYHLRGYSKVIFGQ